jgi:hypothetical protein
VFSMYVILGVGPELTAEGIIGTRALSVHARSFSQIIPL